MRNEKLITQVLQASWLEPRASGGYKPALGLTATSFTQRMLVEVMASLDAQAMFGYFVGNGQLIQQDLQEGFSVSEFCVLRVKQRKLAAGVL
jgi:hypothetical protein